MSSRDAGPLPRLSPLLPFMTCESSLTERCILTTQMLAEGERGRLAVSSQHERCQHGLVKLHIGARSDPQREVIMGTCARRPGDSLGEG